MGDFLLKILTCFRMMNSDYFGAMETRKLQHSKTFYCLASNKRPKCMHHILTPCILVLLLIIETKIPRFHSSEMMLNTVPVGCHRNTICVFAFTFNACY